MNAVRAGAAARLPVVSRRTIDIEALAWLMVMAYIVLKFQPFVVLQSFPGAVSSVLYPLGCIVILAVTPGDLLGRIPVSWFAVCLAVWEALSWSWSIVPFATSFGLRSEVPPLLGLLAMVGLMRPHVLIRRLVAFCVALGVWGVVASLLLPASRSPLASNGQPGFRGTFGHKNEFGVFMVFTLGLVLAFVHGKWRRWLIALCVAAVIGTRSATAGSGLFATLFVWGWIAAIRGQRSRVDKAVLGCLSAASLIGAALLSVGLMPTLLDVYQKDVTFSGRTYIWSESLTTIWRRPLQGYGFNAVWADGRNPVTADLHRRIGFPAAHAHSGAIELTLQLGLVGFGLFIGIVVQCVAVAVRSVRGAARHIGYWAILTLTSLVLMSISEPLFSGPFLAWVLIIWTIARRAELDQERAVESRASSPSALPELSGSSISRSARR